MALAKLTLGKQISNDRVIRILAMALVGAPVLATLAIGAPNMASHRAPEPRLQAAEARVESAASKPVLSRVVMRPSVKATADQGRALSETGPAFADNRAALAMAFAPPEAVARAPSVDPALDYATVAATPTRPAKSFQASVATLRDVKIAEGLRLLGDGAQVELAGVAPLAPDAMCRRIDGVNELCSHRAASRLEILTRGHVVTCRVVGANAAPVARGACQVGKIDLAEDLVKNGLARRV